MAKLHLIIYLINAHVDAQIVSLLSGNCETQNYPKM